ncbi:MAG: phosphoribosylaminoimidazolesuccinocarboxamide synthase [Actinomycetota bacterium]
MTAAPAPTLDDIDLDLPDRRDGKVRVSYRYGDTQRVFITTDRLSAFDRIIALVPHKGQVLNQLAAWWFEQTSDVVASHFVAAPDPNVTIGIEATPLPVEVIVRGAITGVTSTSLWHRYAAGIRLIDGHQLPDGLAKNDRLAQPLITPTTKATGGAHDEPLSCDDVVERGLVNGALWERVQTAALALFTRGREIGAEAGLILADTKYEFGLTPDGDLLVIDEIHTPDSSRWWLLDSYDARRAAGDEPENLDKEYVRRALDEVGYRGEGAPPTLSTDFWASVSARYVDCFERLTGTAFVPGPSPIAERIRATITPVNGDS